MKKLLLNLEDLAVDTFDPVRSTPPVRGTAYAHGTYWHDTCGYPTLCTPDTCDDACRSAKYTTCGESCAPCSDVCSDGGTCQATVCDTCTPSACADAC